MASEAIDRVTLRVLGGAFDAVAREMAQGFTARIATDLLEQYAAGTLETGEARSYSFRWPYYDDGAFPYEELSDEDEED